MKNDELFAEFAIIILKELYESFPIPMNMDKKEHLGAVVDYPVNPFGVYGMLDIGIDVRPDCEWGKGFHKDADIKLWDDSKWAAVINEAETLLGRPLSAEEKDRLLAEGIRPFTETEKEQISIWRNEYENAREENYQYKHKESVYLGTVQFLVHEGFIRIIDIPVFTDKKVQPADVRIQKGFDTLKFALTNKGYVLLNKKPPLGKQSIYEGMKTFLAHKSIDAFTQAGASSILGALLNIQVSLP